MRNLNANYIDTTLSMYMVNFMEPYCYIISRQLKNFFGDEFESYSEEDLKAFLLYVRSSIMNNLKLNKQAQEYYQEILPEFFAQLKKREDLTKQFGITIQ